MKKNKNVLKLGLIVGLSSLMCMNLISCNKSENEYIEVAANRNNFPQRYDDFFCTSIKVKRKSSSVQEIEVYFYSNGENILSRAESVDRKQNLSFKLYRVVKKQKEYYYETKTTEVHSFINTLEYFFSEEFDCYNPPLIVDKISADDLFSGEYIYSDVEYDVDYIYYYFTITPIEEETINFYILKNQISIPVYSNQIQSTYNRGIKYDIKHKHKITFIDPQE